VREPHVLDRDVRQRELGVRPLRLLRGAWLAAVAVIAAVTTSVHGDELPVQSTATADSPGPPLWRVSRGENELWLFGTLNSVPKGVKWKSAAVELAINNSQAVLLPPGARASITLNPVQLVRAWHRARELSRNPDGGELAEVLPPDLYGRYVASRDRWQADGFEQFRPIIAAARLHAAAVEHMGLMTGRDVQHTIERLARRRGIEATDTQLYVDPEALLDQAAHVSRLTELDCFAKALELIEQASTLDVRARAWANGDIEALRRFAYPDIRKDCLAFPGWPEGLVATLQAAEDQWFEAAEHALSAHRSTFGTLDLRELNAADGLLARFRKSGYEIHAP
jgi:uncharacterized protein YbaP (TraB family)